jgi:predicted nucleotidyltransferase
MRRDEIENRTIFLAKTGSQAYGLATPESDTDYKGVFVATPNYFYGFKTIEQKDSGWCDLNDPSSGKFPELIPGEDEKLDCTIYEVRKYVKLALNNNPNILEMLWQPEHTIIFLSNHFQPLLENRDIFLSKKIKYSLAGYAFSQLEKIGTHRSWLLNPPTAPPKLEDYGLPEEWKPISKSEVNAFLEFLYILIKDRLEYLETIDQIKELYQQIDLKQVLTCGTFIEDVESLVFASNITRSGKEFTQLLHQTHLYKRDWNSWNSYQDWKTKRNPKRAELEKKCGFDAKFASHAVRLLRMGCEALDHKTLFVDRSNIDAAYLLSIKQGHEKYEDVMSECNKLFNQLEEKYQNSDLQHKPDLNAAEQLCVDIVQEFLK